MTSGYHGSKISGSQQSFLTDTAICIVERWKKKVLATVLFPSAILHRKVIHVIFFCHICRTTVCWNPNLLLPWQRDVTTSLLYPALKLVWGKGEGGLRLSYVATFGSLYSFSRAFRTPCLLGYFNVDVIDSLISSLGFIITPFMVTDRKTWKQRRKEANKV